MPKTTYLAAYWDTEDYLSAPDAGSDDIILTIARAAREAGFSACYHIIGEKVRSLVARGRADILRELRLHHDTSLHYNYGSIHPTTCELMTAAGWEDGVQVALARERPGFRLLEEVFGKCPALTAHGTTWAPQNLRAAGLEGKCFWQSLVRVPDAEAYWFCGALCFELATNVVLDGTYEDDARFEPGLERARAAFLEHRDRGGLVANLCGHPHRIISKEFADTPYYGGVNAIHERLRGPEPLTDAERRTVHKNLGRLFAMMAGLKGFRFTTVSELRDRFRRRRSEFPLSALRRFALLVSDTGAPQYLPDMTAGEGLLALAEALVLRRGTGAVPQALLRRPVLGPLSVPREKPQGRKLAWDQVVDLGQTILAHAERTGHLPPSVVAAGGEVGLGSALVALADAFLTSRKAMSVDVRLRPTPPWPAVAEDMTHLSKTIPGWPCHDLGMDCSRIVLYSQLMSWTLCPACET